jgi:hypothetical protein
MLQTSPSVPNNGNLLVVIVVFIRLRLWREVNWSAKQNSQCHCLLTRHIVASAHSHTVGPLFKFVTANHWTVRKCTYSQREESISRWADGKSRFWSPFAALIHCVWK